MKSILTFTLLAVLLGSCGKVEFCNEHQIIYKKKGETVRLSSCSAKKYDVFNWEVEYKLAGDPDNYGPNTWQVNGFEYISGGDFCDDYLELRCIKTGEYQISMLASNGIGNGCGDRGLQTVGKSIEIRVEILE